MSDSVTATAPATPTPLRLIFMGTAPLACASLAALLDLPGSTVVAAVTQPDRPKGRDLNPAPSAVKELAVARGLPVLQPLKARDPAFIAELAALRPDLIVVVAYGQILPPAILDLPRHGCLNVHTSLLPRHRGAAPIQWAIAEGDPATGVTIMRMDAGLDTGDILSLATLPIGPADTAPLIHDRLAELGAGLLQRTVIDWVAGRITPRPQPAEGVTYARKIEKEDGRLDWQRDATDLGNRFRAFLPWPGTFTQLAVGGRPRLLKIWDLVPEPAVTGTPGTVVSADKDGIVVACRSGGIRIRELQLEGSRRLPAGQFLAGHPLPPGTQLG